MITQYHPGENVDSIMDQPHRYDIRPDSDIQSKDTIGPLPSKEASTPLVDAISVPTTQEDPDVSEDDDLAHVSLEDHFAKMEIYAKGRFFGQSRYFSAVQNDHI